MQKSRVAIFLVVATLALVPLAGASTIDFTATHNLSFTINSSTTLNSDSVRSSVFGQTYAQVPASGNTYLTASPPVTATKNLTPSDPYLVTENSYTNFSGYSNGAYHGVIYHQLTGLGPQPNYDPGTPDILQANYYGSPTTVYQKWIMDFTANSGGSYIMTMTDNYNMSFSMSQNTGSAYPFNQVTALSEIHMLAKTKHGSTTPNSADIFSEILNIDLDSSPNPLSPINESRIYNAVISTPHWTLSAGDTIHVEMYLVDYYNGWTMEGIPVTPIPSSLLLGASGLLGLVAWGRRSKR